MSWIRMEKELLGNPRLTHLIDQMKVTLSDASLSQRHVTTVTLGALTQLWMLADTHLSDDDVLPFGVNEINEFIGIPKFCEILPQQWLQVLDADHVKLPGYHDHNGTQAKRRADAAQRMRKHRATKRDELLRVTNVTVTPVTPVTAPKPDQTISKNQRARKGARLPDDFELTAERVRIAHDHNLKAEPTFVYFCNYWRAKAGQSAVKLDWDATWRNWCAKEQQQQPTRMNGAVKPDHSAEWAEAKSRAAAIGFRAPGSVESVGAYMTCIKLAENALPSRSVLKRIEATRAQ